MCVCVFRSSKDFHLDYRERGKTGSSSCSGQERRGRGKERIDFPLLCKEKTQMDATPAPPLIPRVWSPMEGIAWWSHSVQSDSWPNYSWEVPTHREASVPLDKPGSHLGNHSKSCWAQWVVIQQSLAGSSNSEGDRYRQTSTALVAFLVIALLFLVEANYLSRASSSSADVLLPDLIHVSSGIFAS